MLELCMYCSKSILRLMLSKFLIGSDGIGASLEAHVKFRLEHS